MTTTTTTTTTTPSSSNTFTIGPISSGTVNAISAGGFSIGGGGNQWGATSYNGFTGWNTTYTTSSPVKATSYDVAASIINSLTGADFDINGPWWFRRDISLTPTMITHFERWIAIESPVDYGVMPTLSLDGRVDTHPAFSSRETFDAFNEWWEKYSERFSDCGLEYSFPPMPCGDLGTTFVLKSLATEDEFCKIYQRLVGNMWLEAGKWIFSDQRDAVMAKMLWSQ